MPAGSVARGGYIVGAAGVVYALAFDMEKGAAIFVVGWILAAGGMVAKLFGKDGESTGRIAGRRFLLGIRIFMVGVMLSGASVPLGQWGGGGWADTAFGAGMIMCGIGIAIAIYGAISGR